MYRISLLTLVFFTQLPAMNIESLQNLATHSLLVSDDVVENFSLLPHHLQKSIIQKYIDRFNMRMSKEEENTYNLLKETHENSIKQGNESLFELKLNITDQTYFFKGDFIPLGSRVGFSIDKYIREPLWLGFFTLNKEEIENAYDVLLEREDVYFGNIDILMMEQVEINVNVLNNFLSLLKEKSSNFNPRMIAILSSIIYGKKESIFPEGWEVQRFLDEDNTFIPSEEE